MIKTSTNGTKTTDLSTAIVPQPGSSQPIQQQVSLGQFDRLATTLLNSR